MSYTCSPACLPARPHAVKTAAGNNPNFTYSNTFTGNYSYDAMGNLLDLTAPNDPELGLLVRNHKTGEGYDAEGRLWKVEYNKLDAGTNFAFYDVTNDCLVDSNDVVAITTAAIGEPTVGQPVYNSRYDLNSDGRVDASDRDAVSAMLGKTCPQFTYDPDGNS